MSHDDHNENIQLMPSNRMKSDDDHEDVLFPIEHGHIRDPYQSDGLTSLSVSKQMSTDHSVVLPDGNIDFRRLQSEMKVGILQEDEKRRIHVSYMNELSSEYCAMLAEDYSTQAIDERVKTRRSEGVTSVGILSATGTSRSAGSDESARLSLKRATTISDVKVEDLEQPKRFHPYSCVILGFTYFLIEMGGIYMYLIPGHIWGVILVGILHVIVCGFVSKTSYSYWKEGVFVIPTSTIGWTMTMIHHLIGISYLIVPLWMYLIGNAAQKAEYLWVMLFAILLSDFLYFLTVASIYFVLKAPTVIPVVSGLLFYIYLLMNVLGMTSGMYIHGIMKTAQSQKIDWLTAVAKGSAQVVYVNFFLQAFLVYRSFIDPIFASEWWLTLSRNSSDSYIPASTIEGHILLNVIAALAYTNHTIFHVFRFENYTFWQNINLGCRGSKPGVIGKVSYGTYQCPDLYYYLISGIVLFFLFGIQGLFSSFRHRAWCMYYLRVLHKPASFVIYVVFAVHSRSAWVLVFCLFQFADRMIHGWRALKIKEIRPYFHTVDGNIAMDVQVATVMKVVLKHKVHCTPGNYAFLRFLYPDAPDQAMPFTIVGGPNGDYMSFNIEINMNRARVASTWFNDVAGISRKRLKLDEVQVELFGPFVSTKQPMTAYDNVIVLAQGIGVTPAAAILKSVVRDLTVFHRRDYVSVTVYWSNSKDKRGYEDQMIEFDDENEIVSLFDEECKGHVSHDAILRKKKGKGKGKGKGKSERTWEKREGPLVNTSRDTFINVCISGGGRGRFNPGFFYKEFSELKKERDGSFGVFCCGKALWRQLEVLKPLFAPHGFDFHNETF